MLDFLRRRPARPAPLELELDASLAARRLARRRRELELDPIKAKARQLCAEAGRPIPPALLERRN